MNNKLIGRLAVLAIVGSIMCSALIAGCGGSAQDDNNAATPAAGAADKAEKAAGGDGTS